MKPLLWVLLLTLLGGCRGRPRISEGETDPNSNANATGASGHIVEFDLTDGAPESPGKASFLLGPHGVTFVGLVRKIEGALKDDAAKGFFVRLGDVTFDWARAEELGRSFRKLRATQRPVWCHAHSLNNHTLWLAAEACDRIWVSPAGDVDAVGIAAQVVYLKGALDKLKVKADFLHMGRFKSAAETMTREGPSDEARESLTSVLSSVRQTWLQGMEQARRVKDIRALMEQGPWSAADAKEHGLIDDVGYVSHALEALKLHAQAASVQQADHGKKGQRAGEIAELIRLIAGTKGFSPGESVIAVIPATGTISMGADGLFGSSGIAADATIKTLKRLRKDSSVKAVVLRIDSPGGSALASDLIWQELMDLRRTKPLVASVGDMAASGGYYMACAAQTILAERTSIVGSIGVVGGKIVLDEALSEFGVRAVTFPANPQDDAGVRPAYLSTLTPWDDATRAKVQRQMAQIYDLFVDRVATGRGLAVADVKQVAEGRIWSGAQGKEKHLVDELGGVGRAIEVARELAGLREDATVRLEGTRESVLEMLFMDDEPGESELRAALERYESRSTSRWFDELQPGAQRYLLSLAPLLTGERVLLAMPYALWLE